MNWTWKPYPKERNFWIGIDESAGRWLTKLRGPLRAYREMVFSKVAQHLGWSCQTSALADVTAARQAGILPTQENMHGISCFLDEHGPVPCAADCPLAALQKPLNEPDADPALLLMNSAWPGLIDWARGDVAAALFGGNEPPGRLFQTDHRMVLIDAELMFVSGPTDVRITSWHRTNDHRISKAGRDLTAQVCSSVAELSDASLDEFLRLPDGLLIRGAGTVRKHLFASRAYARRFAW